MRNHRVTARCTFDRSASCGSFSANAPLRSNRGFTLVELLVVIAVMLILVAMTVTAIDFAFTGERLRSGARQIQSALEGARDRAIFSKENRGLRFLVDPGEDRNGNGILDVALGEDANGNGVLDLGNPRIVTSMIYIGAGRNWSEGVIKLKRYDLNNDKVADTYRDTDGNGSADSPSVCIVQGNDACGWSALKARGHLGVFEDLNLNGVLDPGEDKNGNLLLDLDAPRIKIPADDNGSWYTVIVHESGFYSLAPGNEVLELLTDYRDPGTSQANKVDAFENGGPNTYILELPPRILPDAHPILLPQGICIDLDASAVPSAWRPPSGSSHAVPYSPHMDVMFSSRGMVTGPLAASGILQLYVAEQKDVVKATDLGLLVGGTLTPRLPVNGTMAPIVPGQNQFGPDDPIGDRLLVSLFTLTGKISSHQIDPTDINSNGAADAPFRFVLEGEATSP